jgi:CRP-like cAMP-binding protein
VIAGWRALRRLDRRMRIRDTDIDTLRAVPMLRALPAATIEQLGAALAHAELAPGETVFEQGTTGEHFYVVESGSAEVIQNGRLLVELERGDCFGEIALPRDDVCTATVRAARDTRLRVGVLERGPFLTAVTGYPASAVACEEVATRRIQRSAHERPEPALTSTVPHGAPPGP